MTTRPDHAYLQALYEETVLRNPWIRQVPTEKQQQFLYLATEPEILFGGSAGPGKSSALLMAALQFCEIPNYAALLIRKTLADLEKPGALISRSRDWLTGTGASWNDRKKTWTFPSGASLSFGYLDGPNDRYNYKSCFHPDTEILLKRGWVHVAQVEVGDSAATLNPDTREMGYEKVSDVIKYDHDGELLVIHQRDGVSFAVTPNHNMWATNYLRTRRRGDRQLRKCEARNLKYTDAVPQWANWTGEKPQEAFTFSSDGHNGKTVSFPSLLWADFLGWYISEGSSDVSRWSVKITQTNERGRAILDDLFKQFCFTWHKDEHGFSLNNKALVLHLREHTGKYADCKKIPEYCKAWDREHLQVMLRSMIDGDGHWCGSDSTWARYTTSSTVLMNDICDISIKAGYRPTCQFRQSGNKPDSPFGHKPAWYIGLVKYDRDTLLSQKPKSVTYSGKVHCVTVPPHHTVLTRLRGRISWSGQSEFQTICIDEATDIKEEDYRYMFSRMRRLKGVEIPIRMRIASNPGGISHDFLKQRFFTEGQKFGRIFIPARLDDNPYLDKDEYVKSLDNLDPITKAQLLAGDWTVRNVGSIFRREWFKIVEAVPSSLIQVRAWDLAASLKKRSDYTVGGLMGRSAKTGDEYILDVRRAKVNPQGVNDLILQTATIDGPGVHIYLPLEPGDAGLHLQQSFVKLLSGFPLHFYGESGSGDKLTRAQPFASYAGAGKVSMCKGDWISQCLDELESFGISGHDDVVDALARSHQFLAMSSYGEMPTKQPKQPNHSHNIQDRRRSLGMQSRQRGRGLFGLR